MPVLNPIGIPFIELLTVESTNNYAMGLARAGMAQHGASVFAHEQTKGKGQRSKKWISSRGLNIAMSVIIEPEELNSLRLFSLSMMTSLAVRDLLIRYVRDEIKIKWPNDIFWRDRKAAGILIENLWQGDEWKFAILGIGINVNQTDFRELATKAVSLKQITGKDFTPIVLANELCEYLDEKFRLLVADSSTIVNQYKSHLYKINEPIKLKKANRIFEASFKDVNDNGQMIVQHSIEESFDVGEVEWIFNGG